MSRPLAYPGISDTRSSYAQRVNVGLSRDFSMARYDGFLNAFHAAMAHKVTSQAEQAAFAAAESARQAALERGRVNYHNSKSGASKRIVRTPEEQQAHIKAVNKAAAQRSAKKRAEKAGRVYVPLASPRIVLTAETRKERELERARVRYAKRKAAMLEKQNASAASN